MTKVTANNEVPNKTVGEPNKPAAPQTQAEWYAEARSRILNKLPNDERDHLLRNLSRAETIVRGQPVQFENVRRFVRDVIELGEELFDRAQAKIKVTAPASNPSK